MKVKKSQCEKATKKELKWVDDFEKVIKRMPESLWIFCTPSEFNVMKTPTDGNTSDGDSASNSGAGVNADNIIVEISGRCEGGMW